MATRPSSAGMGSRYTTRYGGQEMTIEYIHTKKVDATFLRSLFRNGDRHFRNGIQRIIKSSIVESDEIAGIVKAEDSIGKSVGGVSRVRELVRDIGLVLNGALIVDIGEICPDVLDQQISVRILGDVVFRNTMTFLPGEILRRYTDISGLWFIDALLCRADRMFNKSMSYSVDNVEVDLRSTSFTSSDRSWIGNAVKRASRSVDDHIIATIHYLQGRGSR
jgi:hypothetical protein